MAAKLALSNGGGATQDDDDDVEEEKEEEAVALLPVPSSLALLNEKVTRIEIMQGNFIGYFTSFLGSGVNVSWRRWCHGWTQRGGDEREMRG